ncbi:MAG TPA: OsmC family protein [Blastocatellia bacterium]
MGQTVNATVKMVEDMRLVGYADSGHAIVLDASADKKASSPMELVLLALGGCTAMDVIAILRKKRQELVDLEVSVSGERAETDPKIYTHLKLHYRIKGRGLSPEAVRKTIELSQDKYCSVLAVLAKSATVEYDSEIIEV